MNNELRSFSFRIHELQATRSGTGTVIDRGVTHEGYCDSMAIRLRVVDSPDYQPGEVIVCHVCDTKPV